VIRWDDLGSTANYLFVKFGYVCSLSLHGVVQKSFRLDCKSIYQYNIKLMCLLGSALCDYLYYFLASYGRYGSYECSSFCEKKEHSAEKGSVSLSF